jgi:hypothetical protein
MALNTSSAPDDPNTFYTKSLMTPSGAPMSNAAITSFVAYMANQGFSSDTVSGLSAHQSELEINKL